MVTGATTGSGGASRSAIIATLPRSGSWLLAEGMEDTGLCGIPREYFRQDYEGIYRREWGIPPNLAHREYVNAVIRAGTTPNGTFGVKLHWGQFARLINLCRASSGAIDNPASEVMRSALPNPHYVYLTRHNKARQAISLYRAILFDTWWAFDDTQTGEAPDEVRYVKPDFDEIANLEAGLLRDDLRWMRFFETNRLRPHLVIFEELALSYQPTVREVVSFVHDTVRSRVSVPFPRLHPQADAITEAWLEEYLKNSKGAACLSATRAMYRNRAQAFKQEVRG